jgi:hypothetical protein
MAISTPGKGFPMERVLLSGIVYHNTSVSVCHQLSILNFPHPRLASALSGSPTLKIDLRFSDYASLALCPPYALSLIAVGAVYQVVTFALRV